MLSPEESLVIIERAHREVHALLAGISLEELEEPATIGGGEWSAKDLVGHLTTWEEIALATIDEWRAGERPSIEETFAAAGGVDARNADEVARKSLLPASEVLRAFDETHGDLCRALRGIAAEEWGRPAGDEAREPERTFGELLGGVLGSAAGPFQHFQAHQRDLRAFSGPRAPG